MLNITLAGKNLEKEEKVKKQLEEIYKKYNLEKLSFTENIVIESMALPHSHPILTLSTAREGNETMLLAGFIHEQMHWYLSPYKETVFKLVEQLKELYPDAPVGGTEGAKNSYSTYLHIIVCFLSYEKLIQLLGRETATKTIQSYKGYRWIYRIILRDYQKLKRMLAKDNLLLQ